MVLFAFLDQGLEPFTGFYVNILHLDALLSYIYKSFPFKIWDLLASLEVFFSLFISALKFTEKQIFQKCNFSSSALAYNLISCVHLFLSLEIYFFKFKSNFTSTWKSHKSLVSRKFCTSIWKFYKSLNLCLWFTLISLSISCISF